MSTNISGTTSSPQKTQQQHDLALLDHLFLKDGKICYQELKLRPESHPNVAESIISFRFRREQIEYAIFNKQQSVHDIQLLENDSALITMLVQDSDETLPVLASRLNELLSPFNRNEQATDIYLGLIERKIRSVANRQKYGLDLSILNQMENAPTSIPSHLSITRWEAVTTSFFPHDYQQVLTYRKLARQQMSALLTQHFCKLPSHLQQYLLSTKHRKTHTSSEEKIKSVEEIALETERRIKHEEKQKKKEEERQKREEEKQKREEERLEEKRKRNEDKKKKEQSQLRLTSLFTKNAEGKGTTHVENDHILESKSMFPPFFVKDHVNMYMVESIQETKSNLMSVLASYSIHTGHTPEECDDQLRRRYLQELTTKRQELTFPRRIKRKVDLKQLLLPGTTGSNLDAIHRPENKSLLKMKLLQFTEDERPAYYGTWTKSSKRISPKNPFAKDIDLIDYDYDSEAEWEPEGEGEDIQSGDEEEDDMAPEATDPEDIGWLVPEGYLSEGEGVNDSDDDGMTKIVQRLSVRPKSRKNITARPIVVGPIFENDDDMDDNEPLNPFGVRMLIDTSCATGYNPFAITEKKPNTTDHSHSSANSNDTTSKTPGFNQEHTAVLVNIIHDKTDSMTKLLAKAKADPTLCDFSKAKLEAKIKDVAIKEKRGSDTKSAWYIKQEQKDSS